MSAKRHIAATVAGILFMGFALALVGAMALFVEYYQEVFEAVIAVLATVLGAWVIGRTFALRLVEELTGEDFR